MNTKRMLVFAVASSLLPSGAALAVRAAPPVATETSANAALVSQDDSALAARKETLSVRNQAYAETEQFYCRSGSFIKYRVRGGALPLSTRAPKDGNCIS